MASDEFAHSFLDLCRLFAWVPCTVWAVGDDTGLIARTRAGIKDLIMKKTFVALTLAVIIPVAAYAAMEGTGGHARGDRLHRMTEVLNPDDSQQERLKNLFDEHKAERKALREQLRARMDEILTPEQRAKREEMREQRREHHRERSGKHGGRHHQRDCGQQKTS